MFPRLPSPTKFLEVQFRRPSGFLGIVAGKIMAVSNRRVARWTISLLGIRPNDRILEVSFGPGVALQYVAPLLNRDGLAVGVDPSRTMVNEARRRNRSAIAAGCIALQEASVSHLPLRDNTFEKAFSINSVQVWPNIKKDLLEVRRTLRLILRLLFDGRPLSGSWVSARPLGESDFQDKERTARDGRVSLKIARREAWIVRAVHMVRSSEGNGADWESYWASLTFEVAPDALRAERRQDNIY